MTKTQYSVALTLTSGSVTLADSANFGAGSAAYQQIIGGQDVRVRTGEKEITVIPFHAIVKAVITASQSTVDAPVDAFCGETESEDDGE